MAIPVNKPQYDYAGFAECGCLVTLIVDDPQDKQWVASMVAAAIRSGSRIERIHHSKAAELLNTIGFGCDCEKKKQLKNQDSLFKFEINSD